MAKSPQTKNGHIQIANEIWDEIIRRDFSKRQISILQFILRLSYGCQKKTATIPKLIHFELCGVGKQNIKKELDYLEQTKVIFWEKESNIFTFNKDYDMWQISPIKGYDLEDFRELLSLNIKEKFSKQELKSSQNKNFSSEAKNKSSQNKNSLVLKTRTEIKKKFSKRELHFTLSPCGSKGEGVRKYIFKDIIKDIKDYIYTVFDHWNSKKIITHRELNQRRKSSINARLENYSHEEIIKAIDNYSKILESDKHYYTYKFNLEDFLNPKNLDKFLDVNKPFESMEKKFARGDEDERDRGSTKKDSGPSILQGRTGWINKPKDHSVSKVQ